MYAVEQLGGHNTGMYVDGCKLADVTWGVGREGGCFGYGGIRAPDRN